MLHCISLNFQTILLMDSFYPHDFLISMRYNNYALLYIMYRVVTCFRRSPI